MKGRRLPAVLARWVVGFLVLAAAPAWPQTQIAVLDFELKDLTLAPSTDEERQRTASVAPMLRDALEAHGFAPVPVDPAAQRDADAGFGYLFEHPDAAAALGARAGAQWIAVGRVHKPSFLFSYLKVRLVEVRTGRLVGDYVVEVKGPQDQATRRGVAALRDQIERTLRNRTPGATPQSPAERSAG